MTDALMLAWLLDAATFIGLALLGACVLYGSLLVLFPNAAARTSGALDRRFSTRKALRPLEIPRASEPFLYRHHRLVAALLLMGAVAFFLLYFFDYPDDTVLAHLARDFGRPLAEIFTSAATGFFVVANVFVAAFALVMLIRPSVLKPLEDRANRWISTRRAMRDADASRDPVDRLARRYPRLMGALILAGSAYIGISLLVISI